MHISRVEKLSRCSCTVIVIGLLLLGLGAIAGTIIIYFYHPFFYPISPELCPRNVATFDEYLCAGEDFRKNPTPDKPFSVIFGPFSPLSRNIDFRLKLNLTKPVDVSLTYLIYTTEALETVREGTLDNDKLESSSSLHPHDMNEPKWTNWLYAQTPPDSWNLLEKRTFSVKKLKSHGPGPKLPSVLFYKKDGIDESYYKLEVSTISFSDPSAVASIFVEAGAGPKEDGILSIVLICVGMAIGAATFIHTSWMLRLSWPGKLSELKFFSKVSVWTSLCALTSFTPLSLMQYFDDTFEYIVANSAIEQLSTIGFVLLLLVTCRRLLISVPDEFVKQVKLLSCFRNKAPVITASSFAAIGSASIALCRIDPALGKSYAARTYLFAAFAAATYAVTLIMMFLIVDCMRRSVAYIESKKVYQLTFFSVVYEAIILLAAIVYVIWHPGRFRIYDMLHFNHLVACTLFAELMCPVSESKKPKKKDNASDIFNDENPLYNDTMTTSGDHNNEQQYSFDRYE